MDGSSCAGSVFLLCVCVGAALFVRSAHRHNAFLARGGVVLRHNRAAVALSGRTLGLLSPVCMVLRD